MSNSTENETDVCECCEESSDYCLHCGLAEDECCGGEECEARSGNHT